MRRVLVALIAFSLFSGSANAATKSPTPTSTASKKATATPTSKVTAKATTKATTVATKKPVVKKTYKPRPRKTVKVTPSPSAVWPPKGYFADKGNLDIYAKIPTTKELIGWASSTPKLAASLKQCETFACGAILAASQAGCNWWEFNAEVIGPTSDTDNTTMKYGALTSLFPSSKPKQIVPYILISQEPIKSGHKVSSIKVACHREPVPTDLKVPSNTYVKSS